MNSFNRASTIQLQLHQLAPSLSERVLRDMADKVFRNALSFEAAKIECRRLVESSRGLREEGRWLIDNYGQPVSVVSKQAYAELTGLHGAELAVAYRLEQLRFRKLFPEADAKPLEDYPLGTIRQLAREMQQWDIFSDKPSPLNRPELRNWMSDELWEPNKTRGFGPLILIGSGPFVAEDLVQFMRRWEVRALTLRELVESAPRLFRSDSKPLFVLGRLEWDEATLRALIRSEIDGGISDALGYAVRTEKSGKDLQFFRSESIEVVRFYSQEMLLFRLFCRSDPLGHNRCWLDEHAVHHPALNFLVQNRGFRWVSTAVSPWSADGEVNSLNWKEEGLLRRMGYSVGRAGTPIEERQRILRSIFEADARKLLDEPSASWGKPQSSQRLQKLACTLAVHVRLRKNQTADFSEAIHDWESDLNWLEREFYQGRFDHDFAWPS